MSDHIESATLPTKSPWPQRLRWFFAEITVVVAGILLALGLQSWWQERESHALGVVYQQQILSDLHLTRTTYQKALAADNQLRAATLRLSEALHQNTDSLQAAQAMQWLPWRSGWFYDPRPVFGNINSLINTGEIQRIQNPRIRASIIEHASIINGALADADGQPERMRRANDTDLLRLEEAGLPPRHGDVDEEGNTLPADVKPFLPLYLAAWPKLRSDAQYRNVQNLRILAYDNMAMYNKEILAATEKMIAILEADDSR